MLVDPRNHVVTKRKRVIAIAVGTINQCVSNVRLPTTACPNNWITSDCRVEKGKARRRRRSGTVFLLTNRFAPVSILEYVGEVIDLGEQHA